MFIYGGVLRQAQGPKGALPDRVKAASIHSLAVDSQNAIQIDFPTGVKTFRTQSGKKMAPNSERELGAIDFLKRMV